MKGLITCLLLMLATCGFSQDVSVLMKEAENFERQLKEAEALEKYKQVLVQQPDNSKALVKAAEMNASVGNRITDKQNKRLYMESAYAFAQRAFKADSTQADASYAMAMTSGKMTEVETDNKKLVGYIRDIKYYADKALSLDPNHAKANYILGKWHYDVTAISGFKKAAVKLLYGGLPLGNLEDAAKYMEKCRSLEPYFAVNYLALGKVYKEDHKPAQALEVLGKLVKLPTRSSDDAAAKTEGAQLLATLQ